MTYAEVKNQFTSVESINTRLEEIKKMYDEHNKKAHEMNDAWFNKIKTFFDDNLNSDYHLNTLTPSNMSLVKDIDSFYRVEFWFGYDIVNYNTMEQKWKFEMNIASCGNFSINNPEDESQKKIFDYYNTISSILSNEEFRVNLEKITREYCDTVEEERKKHREIRSEEQQLNILKKNLEKEENSKKFIEAVKNVEDNTMVVIINKGELDANPVGTHRGTPITIESLPEPNENWKELDKKCKAMNKMNANKKYIATQIRFIKFN